MAGALMEVTADARELEQKLADFRRRGEDLSPIMQVVAAQLDAEISDQFDSEGGGRWAPLAVQTLKLRRKEGRGAKILQDTGRWAGSHQQRSGPDFAEVVTDVSYAAHHVYGTKHIPKRNPYDLPDRVFEEASETILEALVRKLG